MTPDPSPTGIPLDERPIMDRLVSPNGFDGYGPVPDKANEAIPPAYTEFIGTQLLAQLPSDRQGEGR